MFLVTAMTALAVILGTSAGAAQATSKRYAEAECTTPLFGGTCTTGSIPASPGQAIYGWIQGGLSHCVYNLIKNSNEQIVLAGSAQQTEYVPITKYNLSGNFRLKLDGVTCRGFIHNQDPIFKK
jgi:hypothetical protein